MPPKQDKKSTVSKNKKEKTKKSKVSKAPKANKTKTKNAKRKVATKKRKEKLQKKRRQTLKKKAKAKRKAKSRIKKNRKKSNVKKSKDKKEKKELKKEEEEDSEEDGSSGNRKWKFTGLNFKQIEDLRANIRQLNKAELIVKLKELLENRKEETLARQKFMGSPEMRMKLFLDQEKPTDASLGPFQSNRYGAIFLLPGE